MQSDMCRIECSDCTYDYNTVYWALIMYCLSTVWLLWPDCHPVQSDVAPDGALVMYFQITTVYEALELHFKRVLRWYVQRTSNPHYLFVFNLIELQHECVCVWYASVCHGVIECSWMLRLLAPVHVLVPPCRVLYICTYCYKTCHSMSKWQLPKQTHRQHCSKTHLFQRCLQFIVYLVAVSRPHASRLVAFLKQIIDFKGNACKMCKAQRTYAEFPGRRKKSQSTLQRATDFSETGRKNPHSDCCAACLSKKTKKTSVAYQNIPLQCPHCRSSWQSSKNEARPTLARSPCLAPTASI